jgi:hypothetical protein
MKRLLGERRVAVVYFVSPALVALAGGRPERA